MTQLVFQWFSEGIPPGMEIPTTLLCVYLMAPLLGADGGASPSPVFAELYTFVLYQASYAVRFPGADAWTQAAFAASVWKLSTDPATATIARFSSIHRVNQIVLDASEAEIRTDPMLAMGAMVVGLRIVLELVR